MAEGMTPLYEGKDVRHFRQVAVGCGVAALVCLVLAVVIWPFTGVM
jgi:hypothetical protein